MPDGLGNLTGESSSDISQVILDTITKISDEKRNLQIKLDELIKERNDLIKKRGEMEQQIIDLTAQTDLLRSQVKSLCDEITTVEDKCGDIKRQQDQLHGVVRELIVIGKKISPQELDRIRIYLSSFIPNIKDDKETQQQNYRDIVYINSQSNGGDNDGRK